MPHASCLVRYDCNAYSWYMDKCCWNMKNGLTYHNGDCFAAYGPAFRDATLAVTFVDGKTEIYQNVQVCINRLRDNGAEDDGIIIDGTTIRFETPDVAFTVLGVRQYTYTLD